MKAKAFGALGVGLLGAFSMTAHAGVLQGRDLNSDGTFDAYYDTTLDITWLADANYAGSKMTWNDARTWASSLNIYGYTGWRLPTMIDQYPSGGTNCNKAYDGTDCGYNVDTVGTDGTIYSELASMFYDTLGNLAIYDTNGKEQDGWGLKNTGPFTNLQADAYWFGLIYTPDGDNSWDFNFRDGFQYAHNQSELKYAWAVRSGDITPVPIPATAWLFGSGLIGLLGALRFKR